MLHQIDRAQIDPPSFLSGNCYLLVAPGEERRPFVWVGDKSSEVRGIAHSLAGWSSGQLRGSNRRL